MRQQAAQSKLREQRQRARYACFVRFRPQKQPFSWTEPVFGVFRPRFWRFSWTGTQNNRIFTCLKSGASLGQIFKLKMPHRYL